MEDITLMRALRNHPDPEQRKTRAEIAKMFGCSQFFAGMAAPLGKAAVKEVYRLKEEERDSWGVRKRFFRDTRARRQAGWKAGEE
jgi:hypothetical protein